MSRALLKWFFTTEKQPSMGFKWGEYGTFIITRTLNDESLTYVAQGLWNEAWSMKMATSLPLRRRSSRSMKSAKISEVTERS